MVKIKKTYGKHPDKGCEFNADMDVTDQRSPLNDPQSMYEQFVLGDQDLSELDDETIDDFDDDFYDYDDRSEYGVDIALAQQANISKAVGRLVSRKRAGGTSSKQRGES
ncbi:hypothetical protein FACS189421_10970 [Bacteroidia bacterium]|nr:hypothetical protein FACS189421_10970 [Bacteroidia bacterium]